jgi:transcriptional regulator with XRE-family HTH domain
MGDFAVLLHRLIEARRISVHELAAQVPCSAGHISNLRNGKKQPSPTIADRLDRLLAADGELSRAARGPAAMREPLDSRALLDELADQAIELGRGVETSNVGDGTIGQLDDLLDRISRDYLRMPPEPLISRAADVARQVGYLLRERQRLRHARDLYVVGSKAYAFLSWVAGDLGQLAAAAAHGRAALILAEECGHQGARALAFCTLSKTAFWDGRLRRAAEFAREGYNCAPANSTRALLACQEADATDVPFALDAIQRARRAQDEITRDDDLSGVFACGQVRTANYSIDIHLRNGDPASAIDAADTAAVWGAGEEIGYGTRGQIQIGAALALLATHELDGAAERLLGVLNLPPDQRLATLTGRLREVAPALRRDPYATDRQASDLADHIRVFCQEAVTVRALPAGDGGSH